MAANRRRTASERSDVVFHIYYELGPRRSLTKLRRRLREIDWSISLSTLKLYSSRGGWQQRIAGLDAEAGERRRESSVDAAVAMAERHAQLDRALQGAGGDALSRLLQDDARLSQMKYPEIARLLELGMRAAATAAPAAIQSTRATSRTKVKVTLGIRRVYRCENRLRSRRTGQQSDGEQSRCSLALSREWRAGRRRRRRTAPHGPRVDHAVGSSPPRVRPAKRPTRVVTAEPRPAIESLKPRQDSRPAHASPTRCARQSQPSGASASRSRSTSSAASSSVRTSSHAG